MPFISNVTFPGLHSIQSCSITVTDGIVPSVALVTCVSDNQLPESIGTLRMEYDGTASFLQFVDAAVNQAIESSGPAGNTITFQIFDRRWKWRFALPVSGRYNRREPDGAVIATTEKTPQQLAELLLDRLGEVGYSVGDLPNDTRPEIDWIDAEPAAALGQLLDELGSTIVPSLDGSFVIRLRNSGGFPPNNPLRMSLGLDYQSPVRPRAILVSGSLIKYQARWRLEAVGIDTDGEIKTLEDLDYRPPGGFGSPDTLEPTLRRFLGGDDKAVNDVISLAIRSVYRYYRIVELAEGGFDMGGEDLGITHLQQLLPILPDLVETEIDRTNGEQKPKLAYTYGTYFTGSMDDAVTDQNTPLDVSMSILADKGIVVFKQPVVTQEFLGLGDRSADLRLVAAVNVENDDGERLVTRRFGQDFEHPDHGHGWATIKKPELQLTRIHLYDENNPDNLTGYTVNDNTVNTEADKYIAEAQLQFQGELGGASSYAGLVLIELDGAIRQVTYTIGPSGTRTTASRNGQHDFSVPTDSQKREVTRREKHRQDVEADQIKGSFFGRRSPVYLQQ